MIHYYKFYMKNAIIFPGQGAQFVGMCKELAANHKVVKNVFDEVDEALKLKLSKIMFEGPEEELTDTANAQAALMAASIAITRLIEHMLSSGIETLASIVAGHSLGQYTALCAANSLSLADTSRILQKRGRAMKNSCAEGVGAMAACIKTSIEELKEVISAAKKYGICEIANDNSAEQVVISGDAKAVDFAISQLETMGKRAIKLKVSAPFHCPLMQNAADEMKIHLNQLQFSDPLIPVIDNCTLELIQHKENISELLVAQITNRVRWRETILMLQEKGVSHVLEVGPSDVLTKMNKRSAYKFEAISLANGNDIEKYLTEFYK